MNELLAAIANRCTVENAGIYTYLSIPIMIVFYKVSLHMARSVRL